MEKILRTSRQVAFELKLGYLMPVFLGLAILINTQIANASPLALRAFASVAIHPSRYADYSRDALDLQFAPIDPSIIDGALLDNAPNIQPGDLAPDVPVVASPTPQPTATPIIGLPTLPLPTTPPLLPTLPPVVPTLIPIVPTAVAPIINLMPTVLPNLPCVPLLQSCN